VQIRITKEGLVFRANDKNKSGVLEYCKNKFAQYRADVTEGET